LTPAREIATLAFVTSRKPLSPRALRLRAIFLPAVVMLTVWILNAIALRTHVGPQHAGIWMFVFVAASVFLAWSLWWRARNSGVPPWPTCLTAVAATVVWFLVLGAALPEVGSEPKIKIGDRAEVRSEPKIKIGDRGTRPGAGFTMTISNDFHRPQLESLLARAQQFGPSGALNEFACGDSVPDFLYELDLQPAGEYNERLIDVDYAPDLNPAGPERCLLFGQSYLFNVAMAEIDHGPPVDYGYVNPRTGEKLGAYVRGPIRKPICRCDLKDSGREWVAWSRERADELK
jgi:hypothetical protein